MTFSDRLLSPADRPDRRKIAELIRSWEEYRDREGISLDGLSIDEMIAEGRKE